MDERPRVSGDRRSDAVAMHELAFGALVGLAARHGGGRGLLGDDASLATSVYRKSLIGQSFPNFWLEVPLSGEAGFDLHVYYDRGQVEPAERFAEGCGFGMQALFDWFFGRETGGVGVGFAHDLCAAAAGGCNPRDVGVVATGAYVNFNRRPLANLPGFFAALDAEDSCGRAEALLERLPSAWTPWYVGLFPGRPGAGTRVGAFVSRPRQQEYARDPRTLARDLAQAGFAALDEGMLGRLRSLAALPYRLELQLDATKDGTGPTLGADITLGLRTEGQARAALADGGDAARACRLLEEWGMADGRWRHVAGASLSRAVPLPRDGAGGSARLLMSCVPAFIKAKWAGGEPQSAKVYLRCAARPMGWPDE